MKKHLITILLTALIASASLFAQATAVASISGTVTDASAVRTQTRILNIREQ